MDPRPCRGIKYGTYRPAGDAATERVRKFHIVHDLPGRRETKPATSTALHGAHVQKAEIQEG